MSNSDTEKELSSLDKHYLNDSGNFSLDQLHPVLQPYKKNLTANQIVYWSIVTGISLRHLMYILQGEVEIGKEHAKRLRRIFSQDIINQLVASKQTDMWEFIDSPREDESSYDLHHNYPISKVRGGCAIPVDGTGWLKISGIRFSGSYFVLYSGGVRVGSLPDDTVLTCAVPHGMSVNGGFAGRNQVQDTMDLEEMESYHSVEDRRRMLQEKLENIFKD